jgi:hypothetical protein
MSNLDGWHNRHKDVYWYGPLESNTLRPFSRGGVLMPGLFVVGGTNWSGDGNEAQVPKECVACIVSVWNADV